MIGAPKVQSAHARCKSPPGSEEAASCGDRLFASSTDVIKEGIMETFKKRQKAWARKEKQQKKAARKMERRNEKAGSPAGSTHESNSTTTEAAPRPGPTIL